VLPVKLMESVHAVATEEDGGASDWTCATHGTIETQTARQSTPALIRFCIIRLLRSDPGAAQQVILRQPGG
jgi:hypothetical protein